MIVVVAVKYPDRCQTSLLEHIERALAPEHWRACECSAASAH